MDSSSVPTEKRDTTKMLMALLIAVIVVSVGAVTYLVYSGYQTSKAASLRDIKAGDKVMMNYIGRFTDGRVFDTSLKNVALDNSLYPKAITFTARSNSSYEPFNMTAGNYGSGGTIKGFAMGVIGLHVGDHVVIDVKAADAYPVRAAYVLTLSLHQQISVLETLSDSQFLSSFGTDPLVGQLYKHPFWGWDVQVISDQAGVVYIRHEPTVGQVIFPFGNPYSTTKPSGWPVTVESYDPSANGGQGLIVLNHHVTQEDVYEVGGTDSDSSPFVVSGFNATAGTFQMSKSDSSTGYNGEIAGRELFFEVTILKVTAG